MIEELMEMSCWVIDFLPRQVPPDANGQFFEVESRLLTPAHLSALHKRFLQVLLKLNCYEDLCLDPEGACVTNPAPEELAQAIERGPVQLLVGDALLTCDRDDTHMTLYAPGNELLRLVRELAGSEGLFVWQPGC